GNSFNLIGYGSTLFSDTDIQVFKDNVPVGGSYVFGAYPLDVDVSAVHTAAAANQWSWYYLTVGQFSAYAQDEWQINDNFRLTLGLRMDMPVYFKKQFEFVPPGGTPSSPTLPNNDPLVLFDENGRPIENGVGKALDNTRLP